MSIFQKNLNWTRPNQGVGVPVRVWPDLPDRAGEAKVQHCAVPAAPDTTWKRVPRRRGGTWRARRRLGRCAVLLLVFAFSNVAWHARPKNFGFRYCSIFVFIWQILSNHKLTRIKRFVSWFTDKLCNWFLFSSIFNASCMCRKIRCDGESWKLFRFRVELNKA